MQIPYGSLAAETLQNLIEEFVSREGTDYGDKVYSLEQKVSHVKRQLEQKTAVIIYDPHSESCHIVNQDQIDIITKMTDTNSSENPDS